MSTFLARHHQHIGLAVLCSMFLLMISILILWFFSNTEGYLLAWLSLILLSIIGLALSLAHFYGVKTTTSASDANGYDSKILASLIERFPGGIAISESNGNLLFFNEEFVEEIYHQNITGLEQISDDKKVYSLLDARHKLIKSYFQSNLTTRKVHSKSVFHHDDGRVIGMHHRKLTQPPSSRHLWMFYDLTDSYEVNKILHELSCLRSAMLELIPEPMASFDEDGIILETNQSFRNQFSNFFAWENRDKVSCSEFDQKLEDLCVDNCQFENINYTAFIKSHQRRRKEDNIFDLLRFKAPDNRVMERSVLFSDTISSLGGIMYFRDVTRQYEIETMKSQFLCTAAHELRTPMANIFGYTELLINHHFDADKQSEILGTIHQQTKRLVNILNDLLDLTRIEARTGLTLNFSHTLISELISKTLFELTPSLSEHQIETIINAEVALMCDQEKLIQAMVNVLSNAAKYSEKSSKIKITVESKVKDQVSGMQLQVADFGRGMTPSQLSQAFEPFYRVNDADETTGTGLGLSITKQIIELHNGVINIFSLPSEGTTVTIWLPLKPASLARKI